MKLFKLMYEVPTKTRLVYSSFIGLRNQRNRSTNRLVLATKRSDYRFPAHPAPSTACPTRAVSFITGTIPHPIALNRSSYEFVSVRC